MLLFDQISISIWAICSHKFYFAESDEYANMSQKTTATTGGLNSPINPSI